METIMQILQWLVPSGIAGSLWAWLRHRENSKVIAAKERNDAYKEMYDNLSGTLIELQNENIKLNKAVRELNRTIRKASTCRHYNDCPIRIELQKSGGIDADQPSYRQPARQKRVRSLLQQPVPPSVARTAFPTKILTSIPVGTGFSKRSGQATVNVNRISEDSLEVTATCDSLARQVIMLTEELTRIRNETSSAVETLPPEVIREPTGWQWFQIWTGRLAVAVLLLILIKRRLNRT